MRNSRTNFPAIQTFTELISYSEKLYEEAGEYAKRINKFVPDVNAFTMMRNYLLLTKEVLQIHKLHWEKKKQNELKADDIERIVTITRWDFIASLSIAEYTMKEIIKEWNPEGFAVITQRLQNWQRTSFRKIIRTSKTVLSMEQWEYDGWTLLREIRNASVHNNVIMDMNKSYTIDGWNIEFRRGEGLVNYISIYLNLLALLFVLYGIWFEGTLSKARKSRLS